MTLATDLLVGIFVGMTVKLAMNLWLTVGRARDESGERLDPIAAAQLGLAEATRFFRNPVTHRERVDDCYLLQFDRPLVCFNTPHLSRELRLIPDDITEVELRLGDRVSLVDHTTCENLLHFVDEFRRSGRGRIELIGLDRMLRLSPAETSMRVAYRPAPMEIEMGPSEELAEVPGD